MKHVICAAAVLSACGATWGGVSVLLLSSTSQKIDSAATSALTSRGHTVTLGPASAALDDTLDLSAFDVIYLQQNANWKIGDMPQSGQEAVLAFIENGGGLVTAEWTLYNSRNGGNWFQIFAPALPGEYQDFSGANSTTFTVATADATLNAGLGGSFDFPLDSFDGTESVVTGKCGSTTFYTSAAGGEGLVGWDFLAGRVLSFSTTNGPNQLADAEFGQLLANAMTWAAAGGNGGGGFNADCDGSGELDLFDFLCFNNRFVAQEAYGDCDGDGDYDLFDFLCFVNAFNAGC